MIALSPAEVDALVARHPHVVRPRRWVVWRLPLFLGCLIAYLMFSWWYFAIGQVLATSNWQLAGGYLIQWVTYENRPTVTIDADGAMHVDFPRFDPIGPNPKPAWMTLDRVQMQRHVAQAPAVTTAAPAGNGFMTGGFMAPEPSVAATPAAPTAPTSRLEEVVSRAEIRMTSDSTITVTPETITVTRGAERIEVPVTHADLVRALGALPAWAEQKRVEDRIMVSFGFAGWAAIDGHSVVVHKRFLGWANFLFDTDSAFFGKSAGEVISLIAGGERLDPSQSNLSLAINDILYNPSWQHLDVWTKLLETIVMAFIGTLFAALLAFPLSFIAARNITANRPANQITKRFFDFQRSVDMLIWALFFTRAFGPGPISGMAAIFFTDTGSLGKLFSEALENIDSKPREGVTSVGAAPVAVHRFGVLPQVLPVFVSQTLYFWESNTRSATIIGAMGAGGIGLKLWESMRTHTNWPNIFYMVLLIIGTVFIFDTISNALRSRLIGRQAH
ncbi:phosphonate ABC transporter, permease protein PhnE [Oryzibacter oryziterrae]|uniref:phosphonate ABC transporter, permease protein PhnE n=1 Tax=Oryzibacter oryziterrae TaxID=2766474 RepID=UPI001F01E1FF|nr:phosphonate ABC transporter, permease protein PhnE [Oryzibacter oryziterrae]